VNASVRHRWEALDANVNKRRLSGDLSRDADCLTCRSERVPAAAPRLRAAQPPDLRQSAAAEAPGAAQLT